MGKGREGEENITKSLAIAEMETIFKTARRGLRDAYPMPMQNTTLQNVVLISTSTLPTFDRGKLGLEAAMEGLHHGCFCSLFT